MLDKRKGFTRRAMMNHFVKRECFDPTFQFRPFKLYIITDIEGKYAISSERDSADVFLSTPDKKNKYQWVLIDSDTGAICFFYDLRSYMNIDLVDGVVNVKRSDVLKDGLFNFNSDNTIQLRANINYCLGFKKLGVGEKKEGFDPKTQPALEAIRYDDVNEDYVNKWKYVEIYDLRDLVNNDETIAELKTVNASGSQQIDALQKMIENNKKLNEIEIAYRDAKIQGYEQNWFIKTFLK